MNARLKILAACILSLTSIASSAHAQDWPQWRGPNRTGSTSEGPALIDSVPDGGLKGLIVWESEPMPDETFLDNRFGNLGFSSPVGADGRVYLYLNWKMADDGPLVLGWGTLNRLGCFDSPLPSELAQSMEAARISPERKSLAPGATPAWARRWVVDHLTYEQFLSYGAQIESRLMSGADAVDLSVLNKVAALKNTSFDSEDELKKALQATGLDSSRVSALTKELLNDRKKALDVIFCLDLETGETLWKKEYPGTVYDYGTSSTPCLVDGRLYVSGGNNIYCFDAQTGKEIWQVPSPSREVSSSPIIEKGVLVIQAGALCGLDAGTGDLLWSRPEFEGTLASPTVWRHEGKSYAVQNIGLVEIETGRLCWHIRNGNPCSPVVYGDVLVSDIGKANIAGYRLAVDQPKQLWKTKIGGIGFDESTPIAYKGYLYGTVSQKGPLICVDIATGELKWESPSNARCVTSAFNTQSPILVDGRVMIDGGSYNGATLLMMIPAKPEGFEMQVRDRLVRGNYRASSPAIVDGRMLIRGTEALVCYDLRKNPPAAEAGE